jgi:hypothetical protein
MTKKQHGGKRTGAGRKQAYPEEGATVIVSVSIPSRLLERLDAVSEKREWKRSEAIVEAIRGLLKRQERKSGVSIPSVDADPSGSL